MLNVFLNLIDSEDDKEKFKSLYDAYKDLLYWIALRRTNNIEDAEECVQETFFYVAKNIDKIDDVKSKRTKGYLSTIVTGFAIDVYNKSKESDLIAVENEELFVDNSSFEKLEAIELSCVMDKLLDEESKVFLNLKYVFNNKSAEIAQMFSVNDSYVRKKIQYAKEKIRKYIMEKE